LPAPAPTPAWLHRPHARAAGELFGDKAQRPRAGAGSGVPLMPGSLGAVTLDEAQAFLAPQNGAGGMLKAIGGGGGRGMRAVRTAADLPAAYERCQQRGAGRLRRGRGVYVERLMPAPATSRCSCWATARAA
jgi:biotin carboxylase